MLTNLTAADKQTRIAELWQGAPLSPGWGAGGTATTEGGTTTYTLTDSGGGGVPVGGFGGLGGGGSISYGELSYSDYLAAETAGGTMAGGASSSAFGTWWKNWGGLVNAGVNLLGGLFGTKQEGPKYPKGYEKILGLVGAYGAGILGAGGYPAPPFPLTIGPTPDQRALWGWAKQFGAEGMQPFVSSLKRIASADYPANITSMLKELAALDEKRYAVKTRQLAGMSGNLAGTDLMRTIADVTGRVRLQAGIEQAKYGLEAGKLQTEAARMALAGVPAAYSALSSIFNQEYSIAAANLDRSLKDYYLRFIQAPISLASALNRAPQPLPGYSTMSPWAMGLQGASDAMSDWSFMQMVMSKT